MAQLALTQNPSPFSLSGSAWIRLAKRPLLTTFACFLLVLLLVFGGLAVGRHFNVDENVFISSAYLFNQPGLAMYRDFHYNHMPTLVIIYATLFRFTSHLLLAARTFNAICASILAAVIFRVALDHFNWMRPRNRILASILIVLALVTNPIFDATAARAWNHDFPALCTILGFLAAWRGLSRRSAPLVFLSGALIGLAFTARLTFITQLLPFGLCMLLFPAMTRQARLAYAALFSLGVILICLPSLWVWSYSFRNAYFGNFQYPALNTRFHAQFDPTARTALSQRILYYFSEWGARPGNGLLSVTFLAGMLATIQWRKILTSPTHFRLAFLFLVTLSQIFAGITPAPSFEQYLYAATPLMILGLIYLIEARQETCVADHWAHVTMIVFLCISFPFAVVVYRGIVLLPDFHQWHPVMMHDRGVQVAALTQHARLLTLEPIYPAEGDTPMYEKLATGRFVSRVGDYLSPAQRAQYRMISTQDLLNIIPTDLPEGVLLTGSDDNLGPEKEMAQACQVLGYKKMELWQNGYLWLRPTDSRPPK